MNRFLVAWVRGVRQRAGSVLVAIGVVTVVLAAYAATHLGINTHHTAVLDSGLPFWEDYNAFGKVFPILDEALLVVVDAETLTPRQRLVAVPYALEAESANNVGGVGATFVSEVFEHFAFDGAEPPNDDPSEGLGDADGDGIANFVDPDNDNDGISDASEVSAGTDINLVTPVVSSSLLSTPRRRPRLR